MIMEKQFLSEEQMEQLSSLGINIKDASMSVDIHLPNMTKEYMWGFCEDTNDVMFKTLPLYTLQDLLNKLPKNIKIDDYNYQFMIEYINGWYISYCDFADELVSFKEENLIDGVFCIFLWCVKNKYISNECNSC